MSDRELSARAIINGTHGNADYDRIPPKLREPILREADAVLAALRDRLGGVVVPEWVTHVRVEISGPDPEHQNNFFHGDSGWDHKTIESALAAAIKDELKARRLAVVELGELVKENNDDRTHG
jgi:hypothetical protein